MRGWQTTTRRGKTVYQVRFRWTDETGVSRLYRRDAKRQTERGAEAEYQAAWSLYLRTGSPVPRAPEPRKAKTPTWSEFWAAYVEPTYLTLIGVTPGTRERYLSLWGQVERWFGPKRIEEFTVPDWEAYEVTLRQRPRAGKKVKGVATRPYIVFWFGTVMAAAVRAGHLSAVPKYKRPPKPDVLPDCPTRDEVAVLLAQPMSWTVMMVHLLVYSGMRLGEVLALTRGDVDLETGKIWIRRAISGNEISTTKSKRQRWVSIHPSLAVVLRPWIASMLPGAGVIVNGRGKRPRRQHALTAFRRLCVTAHIKPWSLHSLRHYAVTTMLEAGAPVRAVQAVVGHTQMVTTQRYAHARDASIAAAIERLP